MQQPVIDMCDQGHRFAKLPDHPKMAGRARCPHCLAIGIRLVENAERMQDRMMAAILDTPAAHEGGDVELVLRRAWERVRQVRLS